MRHYLSEVKAALVADGFHDTFAQWPRRSQAFGLVKDFPGHRQMHVRAFWDGRLEAEIEFSRLCVNHWISPRDPAHRELQALLENLGVGAHGVNPYYRPLTGQNKAWPESCLDLRLRSALATSVARARMLVLAIRAEGLRNGIRALRNGTIATANATVDAMEAVTRLATEGPAAADGASHGHASGQPAVAPLVDVER